MGILENKKIASLEVCELSLKELIITDENMDFAFMNVSDSFITILMAKDEDIMDIVKSMKWEAIECDEKTYINWYSEA